MTPEELMKECLISARDMFGKVWFDREETGNPYNYLHNVSDAIARIAIALFNDKMKRNY